MYEMSLESSFLPSIEFKLIYQIHIMKHFFLNATKYQGRRYKWEQGQVSFNCAHPIFNTFYVLEH